MVKYVDIACATYGFWVPSVSKTKTETTDANSHHRERLDEVAVVFCLLLGTSVKTSSDN